MSCSDAEKEFFGSDSLSTHLVEQKWYKACLNPTDTLTSHQILWVTFHTILSALVCFGVNFGLTCVAFCGKADEAKFWDFPTSIVTSFALTVVVEISLNWVINGALLSLDVLRGKVAPLNSKALAWWPNRSSRLYWWFCNTSDLVIPPKTSSENVSFLTRLRWTLQRSSPWMLLSFILMFPVFLGIAYVLFGEDRYNDFDPEFLVAFFGIALVFITIPLWALVTLASIGDRLADEKA